MLAHGYKCKMDLEVDSIMKAWITVLKAADTAASWHVHQRRKGKHEEPYINHLLEVAMLVAEATEGKRPDLVVAALLHDAIEDQEVPRSMIAESFGDDIAKLVEELTDDKTLTKAARKQRQIDTAARKSEGAKIVKLADKTSNLRTIATSPPAEWSVQRRLDYVRWAQDVVAGLRGANPWLEHEFDEAAKSAALSVRPKI
jgi:guanosine-3',5'-bis(diphosphate) 3'-pyrophosphohydrolase